jgi:LysR family transcriptional activator of nhaA
MQKQWLNYHHLLYFMTIAMRGSVAGAAAQLKLGQSTLSTQLGQFEEQLGMKLFERRQRRLHLTEAGRIALQYACEIFKLGDEMLDALHDRRQLHRLSVQIGALDSIPKALVAEMVSFAQTHQQCTVSVVEGQADELLRALRAHEIDLALFNHQPATAERQGLLARMAGRSAVAVLGAPKFARLQKGFPQSLVGQPFIMPGVQSRLRHDVEHYFKVHQIHVDVVLEAQDTSLLMLLAAQGAGLIPVGATVVDELHGKYSLKTLGVLSDVQEELWVLRMQRRIENPVASHLFRHFKADVARGG